MVANLEGGVEKLGNNLNGLSQLMFEHFPLGVLFLSLIYLKSISI